MRCLLNSLAVLLPDWLREQTPQDWFERYSQPFSQWQLPKSKSEREDLAHLIGYDGFKLWHMMEQSSEWIWLREVPAVETLRQVWLQQFYVEDEVVRWRKKAEISADRVGLLASRDFESAARSLLKASFGLSERNLNLDIPALLDQIEEIKGHPELISGAFASHPLLPIRLKSLQHGWGRGMTSPE